MAAGVAAGAPDIYVPRVNAQWPPAANQPGGGHFNIYHPLATVAGGTRCAPVLLWLQGANSRGDDPRASVGPKQARQAKALPLLNQFIVITAVRAAQWMDPPFWWLLEMMVLLRQHLPQIPFALMGASKGAWWGGLFVAAQPQLFQAAVLVGGYSSPRQTAEQRRAEGQAVAVAAAAGTRLIVIFSAEDECCLYHLEAPYFEAIAEEAAACLCEVGGTHGALYNHYLLGTASYQHQLVWTQVANALSLCIEGGQATARA